MGLEIVKHLGFKMLSSPGEHPLNDEELGKFRHAAAAVARFLIRARERVEPGFLPKSAYAEWQFADFSQERLSVVELLEAALEKVQEINAKYMYFCESGGFSFSATWLEEGEVGQLKTLLASFVDPVYYLPQAIQHARNHEPIDWESVGRWGILPELRDALDRLPSPSGSQLDQHTDCYVTLDQAAAVVNRSKRSLERYKQEMPFPDVKGGGGRSDEWLWSRLRPWLQEKFGKPLPEYFPADRRREITDRH